MGRPPRPPRRPTRRSEPMAAVVKLVLVVGLCLQKATCTSIGKSFAGYPALLETLPIIVCTCPHGTRSHVWAGTWWWVALALLFILSAQPTWCIFICASLRLVNRVDTICYQHLKDCKQ